MGVSRDDDHREIAKEFAERWGVDPAIILWEGTLFFNEYADAPDAYEWVYQEFVFDEEGRTQPGEEAPLTVTRRRPIPKEWIEQYEAAVKDLYQ